MEFYKCPKCGNVINYMTKKACIPQCCGVEMKLMVPGTTDAAVEKHLPVVTVEGNKVKAVVGSVVHPMTPEHSIQWIVLETKKGAQWHPLAPTDAPEAEFAIAEGDAPVAVWEYCNLHGLWKTDI